ncbi:MAG: hypothetical protein FWC91_13570 [Defluviitaleaceae bacterium]|nr:hypothetical protein [Defluviitaleaceae bacterium]
MKNNKLLAKMLFTFALLVLVVTIAACGAPEIITDGQGSSSAIAVSIVLGNRANVREFGDAHYQEIRTFVERAVYGGYVSVVISDATPRTVSITPQLNFGTGSTSINMRNTLIETRSDSLIRFIRYGCGYSPSPYTLANIRAGVPTNDPNNESVGADLMGAIRVAYASLNNAPDDMPRYIILLDTGISTLGNLNLLQYDFFMTGDFNVSAAISGIVDKLDARDDPNRQSSIPDLSRVNTVRLMGIDHIALRPGTEDTRPIREEIIRGIWSEIFSRAGVTRFDHRSLAPGDRPINRYIEGKDRNDVGWFPYCPEWIVRPHPMPIPDPREPITINLNSTGAINFLGGRSTLRDVSTANIYLELYVNLIMSYLNQNPNNNLYLIGSIASEFPAANGHYDGRDFDRPNNLSQNRAEVIRDILVGFGVPSNRLVPIGFGNSVPAPARSCEWETGRFSEEVARYNRTVFLISRNTELFTALRDVTRAGVRID